MGGMWVDLLWFVRLSLFYLDGVETCFTSFYVSIMGTLKMGLYKNNENSKQFFFLAFCLLFS